MTGTPLVARRSLARDQRPRRRGRLKRRGVRYSARAVDASACRAQTRPSVHGPPGRRLVLPLPGSCRALFTLLTIEAAFGRAREYSRPPLRGSVRRHGERRLLRDDCSEQRRPQRYVERVSGANDKRRVIFTQSPASNASNHIGVICTGGTGCGPGTRNLADLFEVAIDPLNGRAGVIYTDDTLTTTTDPNSLSCLAGETVFPLPQLV